MYIVYILFATESIISPQNKNQISEIFDEKLVIRIKDFPKKANIWEVKNTFRTWLLYTMVADMYISHL